MFASMAEIVRAHFVWDDLNLEYDTEKYKFIAEGELFVVLLELRRQFIFITDAERKS